MADFKERDSVSHKKKGHWGLLGSVVGGVTAVVGSAASAVGEGVGLVKAEEESDGDVEDEDWNEGDDYDTGSDEEDDDESGSDDDKPPLKDVSPRSGEKEEQKMRKVEVTRRSHMHLDPKEKIPIAGSTMNWRRRDDLDKASDDESTNKHVWGAGVHNNFKLRVGPNYKKTGAKEPSGPSLYEIVAMDMYYSIERIENIGSKVKLPEEWTNMETNHPDVPPLLIVNGQVPEVSVGSTLGSLLVHKDEGPGWNYIIYYRLKEHVAMELKDPSSASPAVKLLLEWLQKAHVDDAYTESNSEWFGRFKIIPIVDNIDTLNLPGFIAGYNAKPALIARCGKVHKSEKYWGFDANTHAFGAAARSAIGIMDLRTMVMQWGQCLESREDDEMPEVLLGCSYFSRADPDLAVVWQDWSSDAPTRNQTLGCMRKRQQRRVAERRSSPSKSPKKDSQVIDDEEGEED